MRALFLLDPVDTTVYAPLGRDYPSAVAGLEGLGRRGRSLPLAVVGSGLGGDCVPSGMDAGLGSRAGGNGCKGVKEG